MDMHSRKGKGMQTVSLNYNHPVVLSNEARAVCTQTTSETTLLRVTNLSKNRKATFILVAGSDWDGTYTLPADSPGHQWTITTNFRNAQLTVTNLSPGKASIEVMLMDMPGID